MASQLLTAGALSSLATVLNTGIPADDMQVKSLEYCTIALGEVAQQPKLQQKFYESQSERVLVETALRQTAPPTVIAKAFSALARIKLNLIPKEEVCVRGAHSGARLWRS